MITQLRKNLAVVLFLLGWLGFAGYMTSTSVWMLLYGNLAPGTILKHDTRSKNEVIVEFTTEDGEKVQAKTDYIARGRDDFPVGTPMGVYYDPADPHRVKMDSFWDLYAVAVFHGLFGLVLAVAVLRSLATDATRDKLRGLRSTGVRVTGKTHGAVYGKESDKHRNHPVVVNVVAKSPVTGHEVHLESFPMWIKMPESLPPEIPVYFDKHDAKRVFVDADALQTAHAALPQARKRAAATVKHPHHSIIATIIGGLMLFAAGRETLRVMDLISSGVRTHATVVDYKTSGTGRHRGQLPVVQFDVDGKKVRAVVGGQGGKPFDVGETVAVYYEADHPGNVVIDTFFEMWGVPLFFGALGLFFCVMGTGLWDWVRRRSNPDLDLAKAA